MRLPPLLCPVDVQQWPWGLPGWPRLSKVIFVICDAGSTLTKLLAGSDWVVTHLTHPGHQPLTASFILYAYVSLVQRGSNDTIFPGQNLSFPILHPLRKTVFVFILIPCMLENDSCCYYFELVLYFSEQMCLSYLASVSWIFIFILFHSLTLVKTSGCFNCGWALLIMQEILVKKN